MGDVAVDPPVLGAKLPLVLADDLGQVVGELPGSDLLPGDIDAGAELRNAAADGVESRKAAVVLGLRNTLNAVLRGNPEGVIDIPGIHTGIPVVLVRHPVFIDEMGVEDMGFRYHHHVGRVGCPERRAATTLKRPRKRGYLLLGLVVFAPRQVGRVLIAEGMVEPNIVLLSNDRLRQKLEEVVDVAIGCGRV